MRGAPVLIDSWRAIRTVTPDTLHTPALELGVTAPSD